MTRAEPLRWRDGRRGCQRRSLAIPRGQVPEGCQAAGLAHTTTTHNTTTGGCGTIRENLVGSGRIWEDFATGSPLEGPWRAPGGPLEGP